MFAGLATPLLADHFVRSMLAGMYVGCAITLIFTIGAYLPSETRQLLMGVCFGGALTTVIFAGSERREITDAGLRHLKSLTALKNLILHGTRVTEAGVDDITKALPNCEVN